MAYLSPHFEADAFVSYSHGDPKGEGNMPFKTWTHALIDKLEKEIRSLDPNLSEIKLWFDKDADPTAQLTPLLRDTVSKSCMLIIVMTHYYLRSSWCKDELNWFRDQIKERTEFERGRVFIIRAQPTDVSAWPDFLRDERGHALLGFQFCASNTETPFGWPDLVVQDEEFRKALNTLRSSLMKHLREFKKLQTEQLSASTPLTAIPQQDSRPIFLHTARERMTELDAIKTQLKENGIKVATLAPKTAPAEDFGKDERDKQIEWMKRCDAVALAAIDGGESDEREFAYIYQNRMNIVGPKGKPLPWVVIDRSGGRLPVDPSDWGAGHIDATRDNWRDELREWLARASSGGAP